MMKAKKTLKENRMKGFLKRSKKLFIVGLCIPVALPLVNVQNIVYAATQQINVSFPESSPQEQTKTITLPSNFDSVSSIKVDTGNVSYDVNGNQMTITVKNGDYTSRDSSIDTKAESKSANTFEYNSTNSFPTTDSYSDDDGFSGTLSKNGSSYVSSGTYTAGDSKTQTTSESSVDTTKLPSSVYYDKNGYTGTLNKSGTPIKSTTDGLYTPSDTKNVTTSKTSNTNSFPSTISYNQDGYSGTLTGGTPYVISGTYTAKQTKAASTTKTGTDLNSIPDSVEYSDSSNYVGTLTKDGELAIKDVETPNYTTTKTVGFSQYEKPDYSPTPLGYWTNTEVTSGVDYIKVWSIDKNDWSIGWYVKDATDTKACSDWTRIAGKSPNWNCTYTWWNYYDNHGGNITFDINRSTFFKSTGYAKTWVWTKVDRTYTQTYSGTVTKAASKKTVSVNNKSYTAISDIPDTIPYSDGSGYTATLGKTGAYRVSDVETPKYASEIVTDRDSDKQPTTKPTAVGYWVKGNSIGGLDRIYPNFRDSKVASSGWRVPKTGDPCPSGETNLWIRSGIGFECDYDWWDYYNNQGGDSAFDVRYGDFSIMPGFATEWFWTKVDRTYYQDYSGTAITPEPLDTRIWQDNYSGSVTKPASDTRQYIYTQYYTGTVYGTSSDTRVWRQDYTGTAYKSGTVYSNYKYAYNVTITYNEKSTDTSSTTCSYKGIAPTTNSLVNYLPKCVKYSDGSTNLFEFKYTFTVTGISNSADGG